MISRQDAIDAILEDKICDYSLKIMIALGDGNNAKTLNMTCDRHAKMLMNLPSAEPDLSGYSDKLWKNAYERGKAEAMQWIPCSERLPDKQGYYLVWAKYDFKNESWYDIQLYDDDCEAFGYWEDHYDTKTFGYLDSEFVELSGVLAWMPLPEPYKEDE